MSRSASPIISTRMKALIFFAVPSCCHFCARCRVPYTLSVSVHFTKASDRNVEIRVTDHIDEDESLDLLRGPILLPFLRQMSSAVHAVGVGPLHESFFPVGPHQPDAVAVEGLATKLVGKREQQRRGRAAVVGTHKVLQVIHRIVVASGP